MAERTHFSCNVPVFVFFVSVVTILVQFLDRFAAHSRDVGAALQVLQGVKGRFDYVMGIGGSNRLCQDVLNAD